MQQSVEGKIAKKRRYQEEKNQEEKNQEEKNQEEQYQEEKTVENRSEKGEEFPTKEKAKEKEKEDAKQEEKVKEGETEIAKEEEIQAEKPVQVRAKKRKPKPAASEDLEEAKFESEEYKNFLEGKAKSTFESLFGNIKMVLDGTIDPVQTSRLGGGGGLAGGGQGQGGGESDIREGFSRLRSAIRSLPRSIEDDFRKEFEERRAKSEKVKVSQFVPEVSSKNEANLRPVLSGEKDQIEIDPKTILKPISSEQSNQSVGEKTLKPISSEQSNVSVGEKTVTTYFCPVSDSCKFTLTKVTKQILSSKKYLNFISFSDRDERDGESQTTSY